MTNPQLAQMYVPGRSRGLLDVFRQRYLLKLLVNKELKVRYRGSILGLMWSYVKPAIQFAVFFFAMGMFLGLNRGLPNYAIYLFSGIIVINFFTEAIMNSTKAILENSGLIKKIYLPRELFPVASVWVGAIHFFPQLVVLLIVLLLVGWLPTGIDLLFVLAAFVILFIFSLGIGMIFGSINVLFRDSEKLVEMLAMVATWVSPVLYFHAMVETALGSTWYFIYQLWPVTTAVEIFHYVFWLPTTDGSSPLPEGLLSFWLPLSAVTALIVLAIGQFVFHRISPRFAQEL